MFDKSLYNSSFTFVRDKIEKGAIWFTNHQSDEMSIAVQLTKKDCP